jgi:hypothetical protein
MTMAYLIPASAAIVSVEQSNGTSEFLTVWRCCPPQRVKALSRASSNPDAACANRVFT